MNAKPTGTGSITRTNANRRREKMNAIEKEFDKKASVYESNRLSGWYKAHSDILLDILPSNFTGSILDIGCGTGYFLRDYLGKNINTNGVGIDISSKMVKAAVANAQKDGVYSAKFFHDDWETLEPEVLEGQLFDLIVCANTYHYFSNPHAAAKKMFAALRENGTVYIVERDKSGSPLTAMWDFLHRHLIKDGVAFYDEKNIKRTFENAGFHDPQTTRYIKKYFWRGKVLTNLVILSFTKISA